MILTILACKDISLYARSKNAGIIYETTVENNKLACNMACDMCMYAKTRYYRTPCIPEKHCMHYIKTD